MKSLFKEVKSYWVSDVSFPVLLVILIFTVFILPAIIEYQNDATFFLNFMLISLFFIGIFSARTRAYIILSSILLFLHISLRLIRFGDNPYDFYLLERIVAILNLIVLVIVNVLLLFRDSEVNVYRIIGSINVYLLVSMIGAFGFEIIQLTTNASIVGEGVSLNGMDVDFGEYIYYSLSCISTLGLGDLLPINFPAKMLTTFLSALGILYPAVVIAKLVSYAAREKA